MRPVSRLYLRMALYIGVAIAGFVLLALASLLLVASSQLANYLAAREGSLGRNAASVLAKGGTPALRVWMVRPDTLPEDVALYVLDERGRDLAGKQLPSQYKRFVERFVLAGLRGEEQDFRPIRLAPLLVAPDGTRYAFLLLPDRIAPWGSVATLAAIIAAALVVIAVAAALIARALGKPIRELQFAVRALADGRVATRAPPALTRRGDELGALARDFDGMATRIERLLASRQQLMRDMSHELRSPLARLQAALALAERKQPLPAAEHARILTEIGRMDRAIGDVLRFSRLEAEPIRAKHLLRLDEMLRTLISDERDEAATREVRLDLQTADGLDVVGDPQLLRSGFENVLRNAIRHAPAGSAISVRAAGCSAADPEAVLPEKSAQAISAAEIPARGGTAAVDSAVAHAGTVSVLEVCIEDRGPGVPTNMLERIFEPYTRLSGETDDRTGSGLGLAIARRVFEAHGGCINAEAADPCGLRVRIRLPRAC
jgi:two-component system OmpR family sensor kinase